MIEISNFFVGYSKNLPILGNVNLTIFKNKVVGIKGMNGCGKSTLLKGILGIIPYRMGKVVLFEKDISNWNYNEISNLGYVGYLPQRERIFKNLTVKENLDIAQYFRKSTNSKYNQDSILLSSYFKELKIHLNQSASILSGGQSLLLAIACLMNYDPPILILDEPTDSLDTEKRTQIVQILENWKNEGKAVLIVEQDQEILSSISDEIYEITDVYNYSSYSDEIKFPYTLIKKL
ncbi:MAG: ATP-binding cassette domain-containing protein [Ignavibacteriales bacterium]|nr:ATP-binding cassette domain-containing protein [Ignavibacteriales bacterium]